MTVARVVWLVISVSALASLAAFAVKRLLYLLLAILHRPPAASARCEPPEVLLLVPCRNESSVIERSMKAVSNLDYPRDRLKVVYIDDSSTDETTYILKEKAPRLGFEWFRIESDLERGKSRALNEALKRYEFGELVYILDADFKPTPDALMVGAEAMGNPKLVMATGKVIAEAPWANPIRAYSAMEELVHQHITQAAQSALGLGSAPMGGNYLIRRDVLDALGGFDESMLLEDVDLALRLFENAQTSAFIPQMVAYHNVPQRTKTFVKQHYFWARGFHQATKKHLKNILHAEGLGIGKKLSALFFSFGYLDRLAVLLGVVASSGTILHANPYFPLWVWLIVFSLPLAHVIAALVKDKSVGKLGALAYLPLIFPLDLFAAVEAALDEVLNKPLGGYKTERE